MTKEDIISTIVYLGMIAVAILVGLYVIQPILNDGLGGVNPYVVTITSILVGVLLNVIFVEVGHVLGALVGGYTILSVNCLGLVFYKVLDKDTNKFKLKVKFPKSFDGLTGETIVAPKKENARPMAYILFPLILIALEASAMFLAIYFIESSMVDLLWLKASVVIISTIGLMFMLYNFFPAKLDSKTDGYRWTLLTNKVNLKAYNELLRVEGLEFLGQEIDEIKIPQEITDFTSQIRLIKVEKLIVDRKYSEALVLIEEILNTDKKITKETLRNAKISKLYILLIQEEKDNAKKFYDETFEVSEKKALIGISRMLYLRTYLLYSGLVDQAKSEVEFTISKKKKILKREDDKKQFIEEKLYNEALEIVIKNQPSWFKRKEEVVEENKEVKEENNNEN